MIRKKGWLNLIIFFILVVLVAWAGKGIFKYNVLSTHDGLHHIARSYDAIKTISEGHFPLRWAGSLNYGCGVPIYNFFYPLIYYFVIILELLSGKVIFSLKIISFLSLLVGTLFFYLLMCEEQKSKSAALAGTILYLYAPYRFSLIFVRGSPEFLAYAIFPVVLYLYALAIKSETTKSIVLYTFLATLSGGLLTISHNFTVLFLMPILLLYLFVKFILIKKRDLKKISFVVFSYLSIFGIGAFFIIPALVEKKFTRLGTVSIVNYKDHFPTLAQLIRSKWDYFYSSPGVENDGMSFMLGYAQWLVLAFVGLYVLLVLYKARHDVKKTLIKNIWILIFFILSLITIYLILPWSMSAWEYLPFIKDIQFSWRLLGIAVFTTSVLTVHFLSKIRGKRYYWVIFVIFVTLALYGNRNHLLPQPVFEEDVYRFSDFEKLHYHRYTTTTLGDDILSKNANVSCSYDTEIISSKNEGLLEYKERERGNTYGVLMVKLTKDVHDENVYFGLEYYPGAYHFEINGVLVEDYFDCDGRVCMDSHYFRNGVNTVQWKIVQTPIQKLSNIITIVFLVIWLVILLYTFLNKDKKNNKRNILFVSIAILTFLLFIFLRAYQLPGRTVFSWDQERDANVVKEILSGNFTLIGPRVLGPQGFFLPPYFYYLLTPFYALMDFSPYAIICFILFYSVTFFIASYYIIQKIFNKHTAILFLIMWATIPLAISLDIVSWNPIMVPLLFILLIYSLYKYEKNKDGKFLIWSGLIFGLGISFHVQFILLSPLFTPFLIRRSNDGIKNVAIRIFKLLLSTAVVFIPLVLFDLRNDFINTKLIFNLSKGTLGNNQILSFLPVWSNFVSQITYTPPNLVVSIAMFLGILALLVYLVKKENDNFKRKLLKGFSLVWISFPVFFAIWGTRPSEYYFAYLLPVILITLVYFLYKVLSSGNKKVNYIILASLILFIGYYLTKVSLADNGLSLRKKVEIADFLQTLVSGRKDYNISFDMPYGNDAGYRYVLDHYQVGGSGKDSDTLIEVFSPMDKRDSNFKFNLVGIIIPGDFIWQE